MAIIQVGITGPNYKKDLIGLSTDIKPTLTEKNGVKLGAGSQFYELDTKTAYIFDGTSWWAL